MENSTAVIPRHRQAVGTTHYVYTKTPANHMSISQSMLKTEQDPQVYGTNQAWFKRWCITTNEVLLWTIVTMSCSAVEWQCQCSSVAVLQTHVSQITHLSIMLRDPLQRVYRVGADLALPGWGHLAPREHSIITSHLIVCEASLEILMLFVRMTA